MENIIITYDIKEKDLKKLEFIEYKNIRYFVGDIKETICKKIAFSKSKKRILFLNEKNEIIRYFNIKNAIFGIKGE